MKKVFFLFFFLVQVFLYADLYVGIGSSDITPPVGTPSAGYRSRKGAGMVGVHDPLRATAMAIDNGKELFIFCGVDHLGFDFTMTEEIRQEVKKHFPCKIFIGSSHTHSGGGAYLPYPILGKSLAGNFDAKIRNFYIQGAVKAILEAVQNKKAAKMGIGYGKLVGKNCYRGKGLSCATPREDITLIKAVTKDDKPIGMIYNYSVHPVVMPYQNLLFSADFIGACRKSLEDQGLFSVFFNGAQGDVNPDLTGKRVEDFEKNCKSLGDDLAIQVREIWENISVKDDVEMELYSYSYKFKPILPKWLWLATFLLPKEYASEINLIVFDREYAFLTIPGELSCVYDQQLRKYAKTLSFKDLTIFGLTNDAHGYILLPEAYDLDPSAAKSFGGRDYGEYVFKITQDLLDKGKSIQTAGQE